MIFGYLQPAVAKTSVEDQISSAEQLYFNGKANQARKALVVLLEAPAAREPTLRLKVLEALLDICIHSHAQDCLLEYAPRYLEPAAALAAEEERRRLAMKAQFYVDSARAGVGTEAINRDILLSPAWRNERIDDLPLYLRRQLLRTNVLLALDDDKGAEENVSKLLSAVATLEDAQAGAFDVAYVLSDALAILLHIGQTERAYGLYRASGGFIAAALPPKSVDAASFRLVEAQILQEVGDLPASQRALDDALRTLSQIELGDDVRRWLTGRALTLKSVVCGLRGDLACARAAIDAHPDRPRFASGERPDTFDEIAYLAARALAAARSGGADADAAVSLAAPVDLGSRTLTSVAETYRTAGQALALPEGATQRAALASIGPSMRAMAKNQPAGGFGSWYRPGVVDQMLISLTLGQGEGAGSRDDAEVAFALFQLAGRVGPAFDADAFSLLAQARDPLQRRTIHQALRLKARRDRLEREGLMRAVTAARTATAPDAPLRHDPAARRVLRDFNAQIAEADAALAGAGIATSGANLVSLEDFQASLREGEVALAVAPLAGDTMAYMCVRRDATQRSVQKADLRQAALDAKLVQAGLTASHAPSEALDSQFPAAASVRLYDVLIRPFGDCVRPGDHILWLAKLAAFPTPLAVLLEKAPPKAEKGFDLAAADWLVRRHAITYAGSAGVIVAARANPQGVAGDFDFLGVGDPVLTGKTVEGEAASQALLRGVRGTAGLSVLAPLPETKAELEQSARGFRTARLLTGAAATERRFRGELIGSYRYLSFATHGLIRDDIEGLAEPALVLTPTSSKAGDDDGLLTASEIADFSLAAGFVALSACNTANFDLTAFSQDLPALASAFAVAGVPATLATLWPVESETSKRVVAATFGTLQASQALGPAEALAQAQRAFLQAPPGRAYLHPRFWAPFVVLGDGGPAPVRDAGPIRVVSAPTLTDGGGEVVALDATGGELAARLAAEPGAAGRHASAVQLFGAARAGWRSPNADIAASAPLMRLGPRLAAGGYEKGAGETFTALLETFDARTGAKVGTWRAPGREGVSSITGAMTSVDGDAAAFIVTEVAGPATTGPLRIRVFKLAEGGQPDELFAADLPAGAGVLDATLSMLGGDILLTYSARAAVERFPTETAADDYERPDCRYRPGTVVERRDARSGRLLGWKLLDGHVVTSAVSTPGGVLLAGSYSAGCNAASRAAAMRIDRALGVTEVYRDQSPGFSEVRAMAPLPDGQALLGVMKTTFLDHPGARAAERAKFSAALVALKPGVKSPPVRMISAGSDIHVSAMASDLAGNVALGGSLGGEAAIFRLSISP